MLPVEIALVPNAAPLLAPVAAAPSPKAAPPFAALAAAPTAIEPDAVAPEPMAIAFVPVAAAFWPTATAPDWVAWALSPTATEDAPDAFVGNRRPRRWPGARRIRAEDRGVDAGGGRAETRGEGVRSDHRRESEEAGVVANDRSVLADAC